MSLITSLTELPWFDASCNEGGGLPRSFANFQESFYLLSFISRTTLSAWGTCCLSCLFPHFTPLLWTFYHFFTFFQRHSSLIFLHIPLIYHSFTFHVHKYTMILSLLLRSFCLSGPIITCFIFRTKKVRLTVHVILQKQP